MPDMKYASNKVGQRFSGPPDYPDKNQKAVTEMHRQVGDLLLDDFGMAMEGLLVRHLVLPMDLAGTSKIAAFLKGLGPNSYVNVMDQYRPAHKVGNEPPLDRSITQQEYLQAVASFEKLGLDRLDHRVN